MVIFIWRNFADGFTKPCCNKLVYVWSLASQLFMYFKVFLLSNMSFQSKEEIHFPACTKEVRIFSSLVEPWGRSDNVPDTENKIY